MAEEEPNANPLEQLVELLVYAPVGLLYDYQEVVPRLVRRGRSQVQLARLVGQMAANQARTAGTSRAEAGLGEVVNLACSLLSRAITEVGSNVGLAPERNAGARAATTPPPAPDWESGNDPTTEEPAGEATRSAGGVTEPPGGVTEPAGGVMEPAGGVDTPGSPDGPLPIAGYDRLTARDIIALLGDLSPAQRERVRSHELANRGRKTILAKLDQLDP